MPGIKEYASAAQTQVGGSLGDGLENLDLNYEVTFQRYSRVVLPIDSWVFWEPTVQVKVKGALHWAQDLEQSDDETVGLAHVTFTTRDEVEAFSGDDDTIHVATAETGLRYAFSSHAGFFTQADLWHYQGRSIYPAFESLLLDAPGSITQPNPTQAPGRIDPTRAVASDSLPLWIALNTYVPLYAGPPATGITLYPSFALPVNLSPPYGVVSIPDTQALTSTAYMDGNGDTWRLCRDRVRVTLYGLQSDEAHDFLEAVYGYTVATENFGITNMPVISDSKRPQEELMAIAMRKTIDFDITYQQTRAQQVARQLITEATMRLEIATNA